MVIALILIVGGTIILGNIIRNFLFSAIKFPETKVIDYLSKNNQTYISNVEV